MKLNRVQSIIALTIATLMAAGCGKEPIDVHDADRTIKDWETVKVTELEIGDLVQHLNALAVATNEVVSENQFGEMHHLELALTATLEEIETKLSESSGPSIQAIIKDLKTIATKLHTAGHDQNASMAGKLNTQLKAKIAALTKALAN